MSSYTHTHTYICKCIHMYTYVYKHTGLLKVSSHWEAFHGHCRFMLSLEGSAGFSLFVQSVWGCLWMRFSNFPYVDWLRGFWSAFTTGTLKHWKQRDTENSSIERKKKKRCITAILSFVQKHGCNNMEKKILFLVLYPRSHTDVQ